MTWSEFTTGLATVARTGSTQALAPQVTASLQGLGMICGSEAGGSGVELTAKGRSWYQRTIVRPENERLLIVYAEAMQRLLDFPHAPAGADEE